MVLAQLRTGEKGRIVAIRGGRGLRQKLLLSGLFEGKEVKVISNYGPMTVEVDRSIIAIGRGMARRIEVEPCQEMKRKLSEMDYEQEGVIKRIDQSLRQQIAGMGIREGKKIKMMTKQPIKGPVVVSVDRSNTSIGLGLADKIVVEVEK